MSDLSKRALYWADCLRGSGVQPRSQTLLRECATELDAQAATIAARDQEVAFLRERLEAQDRELAAMCNPDRQVTYTEAQYVAMQEAWAADAALLVALRERLEAQDVEIVRLQNAARSRLRCPQGHRPGESRGACWFCDAERNAELVRVHWSGEHMGTTAEQWHGMWNIANERANACRAEIAGLRERLERVRVAVLAIPDAHELGCRRCSWERGGCDCDAMSAINDARKEVVI